MIAGLVIAVAALLTAAAVWVAFWAAERVLRAVAWLQARAVTWQRRRRRRLGRPALGSGGFPPVR